MADASTVTPALATLGGSGWVVTTSPPFAGPIPGTVSSLWANRPTTNLVVGQLIFASDVGEFGAILQWTGTRWRALNGAAALKTLTNPVAGITSTEQTVIQALLPANLLQAGDALRVWVDTTKSGATDGGNITLRIGTAGTTGDAAITGLSAFGLMAASGAVGAGIFDVKVLSTTSAQKIGGNGVNTHGYQNASSTSAAAAATTIPSTAASALFVTLSAASSGATDTLGFSGARIDLITP